MLRLVILLSGNGSNLQAILDACRSGLLDAQVVVVISNKPEAYGLERARLAGVEAIAFVKDPAETRRAYDARLAALTARFAPQYVILAGWMRLLTSDFLSAFPQRVVNLHPALPGTFPGTHAIERAYAAWQAGEIDRSGVMVHLVPDEGVDNGPVLAAETLFFNPRKRWSSLKLVSMPWNTVCWCKLSKHSTEENCYACCYSFGSR